MENIILIQKMVHLQMEINNNEKIELLVHSFYVMTPAGYEVDRRCSF